MIWTLVSEKVKRDGNLIERMGEEEELVWERRM